MLMTEGGARKAIRSNSLTHAPGSFIQCRDMPGDPLSIADVSELGARLDIPERLRGESGAAGLTVGKVYDGWCVIGGYLSTPVRMRVVHLLPNNQAGVEFLEPSERLKNLIRIFFEPELIGATLWIDEAVEGTVHRYSNHRNCEVEIGLSEGRLDALHVCVRKDGEIRDWTLDTDGGQRLLRLFSNIQQMAPDLRRAVEDKLAESGLVPNAT
jgi:hypothetical protein